MLPAANVMLVPTLQTAVGPVIMISGIGLLIVTMSNRLGRTVDRARDLKSHDAETPRVKDQLDILWLRARLLRGAILMASSSALCAICLIILIFLTVLMGAEPGWLVGGLFIGCMTLLAGALILFISDVNQSLEALRLELNRGRPPAADGGRDHG